MDSFMNVPVEKEFTYEDVINTYNRSGDKKDVAKRFCISVGEVTKILKKKEQRYIMEEYTGDIIRIDRLIEFLPSEYWEWDDCGKIDLDDISIGIHECITEIS